MSLEWRVGKGKEGEMDWGVGIGIWVGLESGKGMEQAGG